MSMRTHSRSLSVLLTLVLVLAACAPLRATPTPPLPVKVKVVTMARLTWAPFHIAVEEGYFAEQGLEIEVIEMKRSEDALATLIQGQLDVIGSAMAASVLNAIARGAELKAVADKGYIAALGCTSDALVAPTALLDSGALDDVSSLAGYRFSVNPNAHSGYYAEKLLRTANLTLDDVQIEDLSAAVELEALEKGLIDVVNASEPWLTRIVQGGYGKVWVPAQELVGDFQKAVLLFGPSMLGDNRDVGKRFMVAYLKGVRQYNEGKTARNVEILVAATRLDRALVELACWPAFRDDGKINVQSVLDCQDWFVEKGLVDGPVTADQFWDPSFVEHANQVLGAAE